MTFGRARHSRRLGLRTLLLLSAAAMVSLAGCRVVVAGPAPAQGSSSHPHVASHPGHPSRGSAPASAAGGHLVVVHDPGRVTGTITGRCHYRDGGRLPDPRCTPGSIDPAVTQANIHQTICVSGYTSRVRAAESQTERFKYDVAYRDYGTPDSERTELDHLVSLELGGSNDAANLWPEYPPTPNPKDKIENALHDAVCAGRVSLAAAQRAIARDWMTAEASLGIS